MLENVIKLIPEDHAFAPDYAQAKAGVALVQSLLPDVGPERIVFRIYPAPSLIGGEENLETIHCPQCGEYVSRMWWMDAVGDAYRDAFWMLDVDMPCCGKTASLNRLVYDRRVGFACFVLEISDPSAAVTEKVMEAVSALYGQPFVMIRAHS